MSGQNRRKLKAGYNFFTSLQTPLVMIMELGENDPVRKCELYRIFGCSHVDGILCEYPECSALEEWRDKKYDGWY